MDTSKIKVQINSLEALERFIGGDPQLEILCKESIINQFAKQYIKTHINEATETINKMIKEEVQKTDYFGAITKCGSVTKLSSQTVDLIREAVHKSITDEVKIMIQHEFGRYIEEAKHQAAMAVEQICSIISERNIDAIVKRRLQKMLKECDDGF